MKKLLHFIVNRFQKVMVENSKFLSQILENIQGICFIFNS